MSFSHVVNLASQYPPARTYSGTLFSTLKRQLPSWRTRARLRVRCSRALRSCLRTFRSFFNLDPKHLTKVLWNSVIIPGLSLLLLPVVLFVVCQLIFFTSTSLLLLSVLQNFIPRRIQLFHLVKKLRSSLHQRLMALVISFKKFGKELYKE